MIGVSSVRRNLRANPHDTRTTVAAHVGRSGHWSRGRSGGAVFSGLFESGSKRHVAWPARTLPLNGRVLGGIGGVGPLVVPRPAPAPWFFVGARRCVAFC